MASARKRSGLGRGAWSTCAPVAARLRHFSQARVGAFRRFGAGFGPRLGHGHTRFALRSGRRTGPPCPAGTTGTTSAARHVIDAQRRAVALQALLPSHHDRVAFVEAFQNFNASRTAYAQFHLHALRHLRVLVGAIHHANDVLAATQAVRWPLQAPLWRRRARQTRR
jgi:hypothetical protein